MLADYHVHSEFSDDSKTPMEMQIEKAIELGLDEICFTDNVDYGIKDDWSVDKIRRCIRKRRNSYIRPACRFGRI